MGRFRDDPGHSGTVGKPNSDNIITSYYPTTTTTTTWSKKEDAEVWTDIWRDIQAYGSVRFIYYLRGLLT